MLKSLAAAVDFLLLKKGPVDVDAEDVVRLLVFLLENGHGFVFDVPLVLRRKASCRNQGCAEEGVVDDEEEEDGGDEDGVVVELGHFSHERQAVWVVEEEVRVVVVASPHQGHSVGEDVHERY